MWLYWLALCWPISALCYWLTRHPPPSLAETRAARNADTPPDAAGENSEPSAPIIKVLQRRLDKPHDIWYWLSRKAANLSEPKSFASKWAATVYEFVLPASERAPMPAETGYEGLLAWVVTARFWLYHGARLLSVALFIVALVPLCMGLAVVFNARLATWNSTAPVPVPAPRPEMGVTSGDGLYYEWHKVAGSLRVVPLCTRYDSAHELYEKETALLLEADLLKDEKRHARCVLRLDAAAQHVTTAFDMPFATARDALSKATPMNTVLRAYPDKPFEAAARAMNLSDAWQRPMLYILRDGERYLRLAMRVTDAAGNVTIERRMVSVKRLQEFLRAWQLDTASKVPGATLTYCMSPAYLGFLDAIFFHLDLATDTWQIWLTPEITDINTLTAYYGTRKSFSEVVTPLPYWQNKWLVDDAPDATGAQHVVEHYDAIVVSAIDVANYVPSTEELDTLERFWLGHGSNKRQHDPSMPFALAVPLDMKKRVPRRLKGQDDTGCYYQCDHILALLEETVSNVTVKNTPVA